MPQACFVSLKLKWCDAHTETARQAATIRLQWLYHRV